MLEAIVQFISVSFSLPADQIRCVVLLFLGYPLGFVLRHILHHSRTSLHVRHLFSALTGLTLATLCFGWYTLVLAVVVGVSYVLLLTIPPQTVQRYTMVWVMASLSAVHLHRTLTDYGGWHLDISGPMMILIQKLSLVAFEVHDGRGSSGPLNDDQEKQKLCAVPTVLEYMSYCFNFHSVLAGPAVTMREHLAFMDGSNFQVAQNSSNDKDNDIRSKGIHREPSALYPVLSKLVVALAALVGYVYLSTHEYGTPLPIDPSSSIPHRLAHFYIVEVCIRCRYYFLFVLNDSINNAAGLGFEGYDDRSGRAKWGLTSNINIVEMELSMNIRNSINSWNTKTALWLRRVCYERVSWHPTLQTFILSAWWHGFYPGYYCCFISYSLSLQAAKKMRRMCNPFFTSHGPVLKWVYHIVTWTVTQIYVGYNTLPHVIMWLPDVWTFWQYHYFIPHLAVVAVLVCVPSGKSHRRHGTIDEHTASLAINDNVDAVAKSKKQD